MPLIYAVEEYTPNARTYGVELHRRNSDVTYHLVSQEIAEADEEKGVFCLTNNAGEPITKWTLINHEWVEKTMQAVKNYGGPHKDILGEELAVGDYVGFTSTSTQLGIGRVIGFTESKVRLIDYTYYFGTLHQLLKVPSGLMKIQSNRFSE